MNAEQFYQEFKNSLSHLGVRWGDMAEVEVWVEDDTFYMMLDGKQTSLAVLLNSPKEEPTLKWCDKCGEGITDFCRAKGDFKCDLPKAGTAQPELVSPLSRERVKEILRESGYDTASAQARADFINGIRHGEVAHGINGAAAKGGAL